MPQRRKEAARNTAGSATADDGAVRALVSLVNEIARQRDEHALIRAALDHFVGSWNVESAVAVLVDEHQTLQIVARAGNEPGDEAALLALAQGAVGESRAAIAATDRGYMCAAPLVTHDATVGAVVIVDRSGAQPFERSSFEILGRHIGLGIENARLYAELRASSTRAEVMSRISSTLGSGVELKDVVPTFASELRSFQPFDRLVCAFLNESRDYFELLGFPAGATWGLGSVIPLVGSGPGTAVADNKPVVQSDLLRSRRFLEDMRLLEEEMRSYLIVPLNARGQSIGALCLASRKSAVFDGNAATRLQPVADAVALSFENARLFLKTRELSITDDVTPLYNFRFFHQILDRELKFVDRYGNVVSLIFLDLDRFKPINDQYGHLRGSRVLREVGFLLRSAVRETDYPARYGGDEFCVILPQTSENAAVALGEKLRRLIESQTFLQEEGFNVSVGASLGIASYPTGARSKDALIRLADERMYADKDKRKAGR